MNEVTNLRARSLEVSLFPPIFDGLNFEDLRYKGCQRTMYSRLMFAHAFCKSSFLPPSLPFPSV